MTVTCLPADIPLLGHYWNSPFQNWECEVVLRNIIMLQKKANPEAWTSFSWDEYQAFCTHRVTASENRVLDTFVGGGAPVLGGSTQISPGWLAFDGERYSFTPKMILMLWENYANNGRDKDAD